MHSLLLLKESEKKTAPILFTRNMEIANVGPSTPTSLAMKCLIIYSIIKMPNDISRKSKPIMTKLSSDNGLYAYYFINNSLYKLYISIITYIFIIL